jgi:hypothetical protein
MSGVQHQQTLGLLHALDGLLVSHLHYDYLSFLCLELLGRSTPLVVPCGAGTLLRRCRFERVIAVDPEAYYCIP